MKRIQMRLRDGGKEAERLSAPFTVIDTHRLICTH